MSTGNRNLQRNAADPAQVKRAERKAKSEEARFDDALRAVMATPAGRIVLWGVMGWRPTDQTVFDHSGSQMYFREGERNIILRLKASMIGADEDAYQLMEREMRAYARGQEMENAAVNTTAATEGETTDE